MKKKDIFEGEIEGMDFPDKGWMYIEDRKVSVKYALPGQKVRIRIGKVRKDKAEASLLKVMEQSAAENMEQACPHAGVCGGCLYQTMPYKEELRIKEEQGRSLLRPVMEKFGQLHTFEAEPVYEGIFPSPRFQEYRNKMEYSFGDRMKDGPLALGMHKRGSFYDIVTAEECKIVHRDFGEILHTALDFFTREALPFYRKMQRTGYLRHLLVRRAGKTGQILVGLVTCGRYPENAVRPEKQMLSDFVKKLLATDCEGAFSGILHIINDSMADVVQGDRTEILYGQDCFYEELLGLKFKITPFSFFQTNSLGAEILYSTVQNYVNLSSKQGPLTVFDLYSGTGTIAQLIASAAGQVTGVEIVEEAVRAARENAKRNGLENCTFIAGDVLKVLDEITRKPDYIILDPPREGIHPKALKKIVDYGVKYMIYISCKLTSLSRDLDTLMEAGYRVEKWRMIDMFPRTGNIETVCLLSKLQAKQHIEIDLNMDELDLTSAEKKATYQEIKDYVLEHSGLKVSSLYIAQVKQKCGIIERENYNKSKSEDAKQPQCPPEKEKAIKEALKHFGMV